VKVLPVPQHIRVAAHEDTRAIANLLPHLGYQATVEQVRSRLVALLADPQCAVFVAEVNGQVIGLCLVSTVKHLASAGYAEVLELVVHAEFQRRGVGRSLLVRAQAWASSQGHTRMRLRSGVHRTESHRFYERLGYSKSRASYAFELALKSR
jgi:GNAT superfamily N-acetyltransferase